jgi:hypothetical protein
MFDISSVISADSTDPTLPLSRYRFFFRVDDPARSSPSGYAGSAWRGVLGHALYKLVCVTQCKTCPECLLYRSCVYPYVFETPPPEGSRKLSKYNAVPHPFVLDVPWKAAEPGDGTYTLGFTLFGRANQYLAYLVHALGTAAKNGVKPIGQLSLLRVEQQDLTSTTWTVIHENGGPLTFRATSLVPTPKPPARIRLRLHTPLRLRHEVTYVGADRFQFSDLLRNLLRRISALTYFHTDTPLETDFAGICEVSREVVIESRDLHWKDWTRRSSRQNEFLQMGGLLGSCDFSIQGHEQLWPYLWLGQWTHAGKGTSMGLGRYQIETISEPLEPCR